MTDDDYDAAADMSGSIEECYRAIRERHDNRISFETRLEVLHRADGRCEHCGRTMRLELHHTTYANAYGNELPEDLMALCRDCHAAEHGLGQ